MRHHDTQTSKEEDSQERAGGRECSSRRGSRRTLRASRRRCRPPTRTSRSSCSAPTAVRVVIMGGSKASTDGRGHHSCPPPPPPTSLIRIARRWCPGLRAVPAAPDPDPGAAAAAAPPHVDGALPPPQRHHLGPHTLAESPAAAHPCAHGRAAARAAGRDLREGPGAAARPPRSVSE